MKDEQMRADREYVEARWEQVVMCLSRYKNEWLLRCGPVGLKYFPQTKTEAEAWAAARLFTEQREEEIRQIDEEIYYQVHLARSYGKSKRGKAHKRTLTRLESMRESLTKGMKPQGEKQ